VDHQLERSGANNFLVVNSVVLQEVGGFSECFTFGIDSPSGGVPHLPFVIDDRQTLCVCGLLVDDITCVAGREGDSTIVAVGVLELEYFLYNLHGTGSDDVDHLLRILVVRVLGLGTGINKIDRNRNLITVRC